MNKDILFYSNHNDYSKHIITIVKKNNIKNIFPLCIDDSKIKIPNFITVVPSIYVNESKEIIIDENIKLFIDKKIEQDKKQMDSIEPYGGISFSGNYHDIDLNTKEEENQLDSFFKEGDKPDESKVLGNRENSIDSLQQLRNTDIKQIFEK